MQTAKVITENKGTVYNIDEDMYKDIDLSEFSDEELSALGIDPSSVEREGESEEDEEDSDEEQENLEDDDESDSESDEDEPNGTEEDSEDQEDEEQEDNSEEEKDIRIPKARFDEAVQKERAKLEAAEAQNTKLMEQVEKLLQNLNKDPAPKVEEKLVDIDELETQYANHLLNGETEEAIKVKKEINKENTRIINELVKEAKKSAKEETTQEVSALSEKEKMQNVINTSLSTYTFLDDKSDDFNEEVVEEINILAAGYKTSKGLSESEALQKAVDKIAKPLVKKTVSTQSKPKTEERKKAKAKQVAKEPPRSPSSRVKDKSLDEFDWENMSEKDFDNLYKKNPEIVDRYLKGIHV